MNGRFDWAAAIFLRYYRKLGVRVTAYALLSIAAAGAAPLVNPFLPAWATLRIDMAAVASVLTIIASSMLAVSTFSLSVMVAAHRAAADTTTPRVLRVLLEDTKTQSALAAFIGAFVYSLGAIVLYRSGFYSDDAATVMMAVTVLVVAGVVVALLRWIGLLSNLGTVDHALATARERARDVLLALAREPGLGGRPLTAETVLPLDATPLKAPRSGFVQLVDVAGLRDCLPEGGAIYVTAGPGAHVLEGEPIAEVSGALEYNTVRSILGCFAIGQTRTFERDAAFGLTVMSEIASKALSPGVNDPGTAIQTVDALKEMFWDYIRQATDPGTPAAAGVHIRVPSPPELVEAAFAPIARDGADTFEVALSLRQALAVIARADDPALAAAARDMAARSLLECRRAGLLEADLARLLSVKVPRAAGD